jgi:Bacterial Ig-like domain (group 3)
LSKIRTSVYEVGNTKWFLPLLYFFALALLLLRKPIHVLALPARWEDIGVLLWPAIQHSWGSIVIVHYYYFHFIPTLVTLFSLQLLGVADAPLGMNLAAIIITSLCAVFFATSQFRFIIRNDLLRALCGLFVVLVPGITEEIYSNISSIQWFLNIFVMLFVALLLFRYDEFEKKSKKKKYLYTFFCSMSFLSSAFSVIFLPVLFYVIMRECRRKKNELVTISSYIIPTVLLFVQALTIFINYLQQPPSSAHPTNDIVLSTVNGLTISATKIFYHNTPGIFGHIGEWMYLIPITMIAFILLNSIKNGIKFEVYTLVCIVATLFLSSVIKSSLIDWNCLCGQAQERYFFFTIVFLFILIARQLDKKRSLPLKLVFLAVMTIVVLNVASGFFIPIQADENWNYVTKFYDPSGKYQCYIGELPNWSITIPCAKPISSNTTITNTVQAGSGPSITFTPPVQPTVISITSSSLSVKSGQPITFTATISPTPDYGQVQFYIDGTATGNPITLFGGQAVFNTSLPVGPHQIYASYLGAPDFNASNSGNVTVTVSSASNP